MLKYGKLDHLIVNSPYAKDDDSEEEKKEKKFEKKNSSTTRRREAKHTSVRSEI